MDFCDVDNPKTQALLTQILQNNNWSGWGLINIYGLFADLVEAVMRIAGAAVLSVSLFTLPVPPGSPLVWLNSPLCLGGMGLALVISVALSGALFNRARRYWSEYDGTQGNRGFSYFYFIAMRERERAADIRTYAQDKFLEDAGRQDMGSETSFGPGSTIGRQARGPMGALCAEIGRAHV